jgi:hypothetical protein
MNNLILNATACINAIATHIMSQKPKLWIQIKSYPNDDGPAPKLLTKIIG